MFLYSGHVYMFFSAYLFIFYLEKHCQTCKEQRDTLLEDASAMIFTDIDFVL